MSQRARALSIESLAKELAEPVSGSRSEAALRQYMFNPQDTNRAVKKQRVRILVMSLSMVLMISSPQVEAAIDAVEVCDLTSFSDDQLVGQRFLLF